MPTPSIVRTSSRTRTAHRRCAGGSRHEVTTRQLDSVSELFDLRPGCGARSTGSSLTDVTYHRHVVDGVRPGHRPRRVRPPRGAQRVPATHRRRARARARPRADDLRRRVRAAHRQRPVAARRRLGVLLRWRPADPRAYRLPVRRGRDRRHDRPGAGRPAPHPRGAAPDPVHAQDRHRGRAGLGGRRRPQPARRRRPHAGQPRARPVQADRRRRRQLRRRLRVGLPRPSGRPEVRPRDLLPRPPVRRRGRVPHGHGERGRAARATSNGSRSSGPPRSTARARPPSGCSSSRSTSSTTDWSASSCSPARRPASRTRRDEAVEGRDAFLEKRDPDWSPYRWQF